MNVRPAVRSLATIASLCVACLPLHAAESLAKAPANWPEGMDPATLGKRVAENFLPRKFRYETNPAKARLGVIYPEACTWQSALAVAQLTGDDNLSEKLVDRFTPLLGAEGETRINRSPHVDYRLFGIVPLEIYQTNGDKRCLALGLELADAQWKATSADGITTEARYWIDDMYMIPAIQCAAFRATKDAKYSDHAATAMTTYLKKLQQPNGLFHHGPDSAFFWGRGNGWVAAGMADILRDLPEDHPQRKVILDSYQKMMTTLLRYQSPDGMWRQLIDDPESWEESSGTAMMASAMIAGVKSGWLEPETFAPAARKAWLALAGHVDKDGNVGETCIGTDKGFSREYYLERPRANGDLHGQASFLWVVAALLRDAR